MVASQTTLENPAARLAKRLVLFTLYLYPLLVFPVGAFGRDDWMFFYPRLTLLAYVAVTGVWIAFALSERSPGGVLERLRAWPLELKLGAAYLAWAFLANVVFTSNRALSIFGYDSWRASFLLVGLSCVLVWLAGYLSARVSLGELLGFGWPVGIIFGLTLLEAAGARPLFGSPWWNVNPSVAFNGFGLPITTIGNPVYLAALFALASAIPLHALIYAQGRWRLAGAALFLYACVAGAVLCQSRASYVALGVVVLALAAASRLRPLPRWALAAGVVALALPASTLAVALNRALAGSGGAPGASIETAYKIEPGGSLGNRIAFWKGALRLTAERPLTGWGYETIQDRLYDAMDQPDVERFFRRDFALSPDLQVERSGTVFTVLQPTLTGALEVRSRHDYKVIHPHNALVDELYSNGVPGFVLYVLFHLAAARRILLSGDRLAWSLLFGYAGYEVALLSLFNTVALTPVACLLLGAALGRSRAQGAVSPERAPSSAASRAGPQGADVAYPTP